MYRARHHAAVVDGRHQGPARLEVALDAAFVVHRDRQQARRALGRHALDAGQRPAPGHRHRPARSIENTPDAARDRERGLRVVYRALHDAAGLDRRRQRAAAADAEIARHRAAVLDRRRQVAAAVDADIARHRPRNRRRQVPAAIAEDADARSRAHLAAGAHRHRAAADQMHARPGSAHRGPVHRHRLVARARRDARAADPDALRAARDARARGNRHRDGAVAGMRNDVKRLHAVPLGADGAARHVHLYVAGVVGQRVLPDRVLPVGVVGSVGKGGQRRLQIGSRSLRQHGRQRRPLRGRERVAAADVIGDRRVGQRHGADARARKTQYLLRRRMRQRAVAGRRGGRCGALPQKLPRRGLPRGVVVVGGKRRQRRRQRARILRRYRVEDSPLRRRQRLVRARDPAPDESLPHRRADRDASARRDVDHRHGPSRVVRHCRARAHRVAARPPGPGEDADIPRLDRARMRHKDASRGARIVRKPPLHADGERRLDHRRRPRPHGGGSEAQVESREASRVQTLDGNFARRVDGKPLRARGGIVHIDVGAVGAVARRRDGAARHFDGARSGRPPLEDDNPVGARPRRFDGAARHAHRDVAAPVVALGVNPVGVEVNTEKGVGPAPRADRSAFQHDGRRSGARPRIMRNTR